LGQIITLEMMVPEVGGKKNPLDCTCP